MKVYAVYYRSNIDGRFHLWGLYKVRERADGVLNELIRDRFTNKGYVSIEDVIE